MATNCLAGCIKKYACQPINIPMDSDVASPFVRVTFKGSGLEITVGNKSAPCCEHGIIIKSFEYGVSNGYQITVEIHDEEGGQFDKFVDNVVKCGKKMGEAATKLEAEWGWIITTCEGLKRVKKTSQCLPGIIQNLEVSFADGKAKYKLTCTPLPDGLSAFKDDTTQGNDKSPMHLVPAIKKLCNEAPAMQVEFVRRNESGQKVPMKWKANDSKGRWLGPKGVYNADSQNRLSCITKWLEPFVTENNKGMVMYCDNSCSAEATKLSIWEDLTEECKEGKPCGPNSIGTFIVNAGGCSNVIEFTPSINWMGALAKNNSAGGGTNSAADGGREQMEDAKPCPEKDHGVNSGIESKNTISRFAWDYYGPKEASKEVNKNAKKQHKANLRAGIAADAVKADIRIIGDPSDKFLFIAKAVGKSCTVVMINPFHIIGSGDGGCGDWLARPGCNNVLSNKAWKVEKMDHIIKEGWYETIISVYLDAPGIHVDSGEPLGGSGSLGYKPRNTC